MRVSLRFYPVIYSLQTPLKHVLHPSDCLVRRSGAERRLKLLKGRFFFYLLPLNANLESVQLWFKFAALILLTYFFFFFFKEVAHCLVLPQVKKKEKGGAPQKTLSGGFIATIYLSGGLLNLIKSLLAP